MLDWVEAPDPSPVFHQLLDKLQSSVKSGWDNYGKPLWYNCWRCRDRHIGVTQYGFQAL